MKKELKDLLSADKKVKLTVEQQVRLKSLADSADEKQEIDCLIAGSIEADRPKTVSDKSLDFVALLELALLSEIIRVRVCLCVCVCVWRAPAPRSAVSRMLARLLPAATVRTQLPPFQLTLRVH